jgi:hypothetical protein
MKVWNWAAIVIASALGLSAAAPAGAQTHHHHHRHHASVAAVHPAVHGHHPGAHAHASHGGRAHRRLAGGHAVAPGPVHGHGHGKRRHGHHLAAAQVTEAAPRLKGGHRHAKLCRRVGAGRHAAVTCR